MNQESRTSGVRALLNRLDYLLLDMRSKLGLITVILNYGFAPAHAGLASAMID
jgi:hypothetical protein